MADPNKITILLADEDALRRDGLAAVLQGTARFEIIAQCPDGEAALNQMRERRPDVAVVDLNIPKLHGIELIRRVRSESLGTKIVILSGSTDDDIIREVVRAGGDAYLLKNGPARHLIDAISYVCDGGQYFSPQLRRDGLDRHLLQEVPRPPVKPAVRDEDPVEEEDDGRPVESRGSRESRYGRARRPPVRRTADPQRLRERLREESDGENLEDRDYEILTQMADGIRPILDRLDEIEGRINGMESGDEPVPSDVRGWLSTQMTDTFRGSGSKDLALGRTVQDLEARLPSLIEEAVTSRFHHLADKLQQEIEDTHVRTLETFVKNIQVKLVQRVSALETDMSKQAEAMNQLREYSQRTEDNLSRLISGVDKLAHELPKRLEAVAPSGEATGPDLRVKRRKSSSFRFSPKVFWMVVAAVLVIVGSAVALTRLSSSRKASAAGTTAPAGGTSGSVTAASSKPVDLPANADTKTKLQAAQEYADKKDYATAEDIFKQVVKAEPRNVDALKGLADVLYREDKIEESAEILDKIPHN
jgi:DNA-binding NarL/FixJ family response regulator/TolA-binding protein